MTILQWTMEIHGDCRDPKGVQIVGKPVENRGGDADTWEIQ